MDEESRRRRAADEATHRQAKDGRFPRPMPARLDRLRGDPRQIPGQVADRNAQPQHEVRIHRRREEGEDAPARQHPPRLRLHRLAAGFFHGGKHGQPGHSRQGTNREGAKVAEMGAETRRGNNETNEIGKGLKSRGCSIAISARFVVHPTSRSPPRPPRLGGSFPPIQKPIFPCPAPAASRYSPP